MSDRGLVWLGILASLAAFWGLPILFIALVVWK